MHKTRDKRIISALGDFLRHRTWHYESGDEKGKYEQVSFEEKNGRERKKSVGIMKKVKKWTILKKMREEVEKLTENNRDNLKEEQYGL